VAKATAWPVADAEARKRGNKVGSLRG